ncbi:protein aurora borealis-like isoform X1 [Daphnia carinata]|uniref:protein aurora borealis-like isoform X1 n=1 Tax=Daphnia carinata TaxID=120202 RepID=UPI00257D1F2A|nr:protein aurora borealis-like isoform X1 [Daphnia carinata]
MTDNTRRTLHDQFSKSDAYRSPNRILQTKYAESFSHFMEQVQYHTPMKAEPNKENIGASPMQWNSPSMTPPPSFTSIKTPIKNNPKNPFDANLTEHLHLETFSPSVFSRVLSPSEDQDSNWRIEHVALLNPTDFSPNFNHHLTDPTTEAEAQEKILQFFSQKQIAPSPWSHPRTRVLARSKSKTPGEVSPSQATCKNVWTQTSLSFPPVLPLEVEEILSQYMNDPQDHTAAQSSTSSNSECDDSSLNASSLRRKLFSQMNTTPQPEDAVTYVRSREQSSSPILTTGPHSSRFSFSPSSHPVSPPILSPISAHLEESAAMDEATSQNWGSTDLRPSSFPDRTVLMETYEAGYFGGSPNVIKPRDTNFVDEIKPETMHFGADKVGQPKECSTPTKILF